MNGDEQAEDPAATFDLAALEALYAAISAPDGVEVGALLARLDELFARPRSAADLQAYREGRGRWKRLADEVAPVARLLKHLQAAGRVRFGLDDQPTDAWFTPAEGGPAQGVEVTRALARSKIEAARDLQDEPMGRGFVGLPDATSQKTFDQARERRRITHAPHGVEAAIEAGVAERLRGKSADKFAGQTLLVVAPLSARPSHDWSGMAQRLDEAAQATAFRRIILMDETEKAEPVVILDRPCSAETE